MIILHINGRHFAELVSNIGFSEFDFYDLYRSTFEKSELGRMKKLFPFSAMAEHFGLVSKSMRPEPTKETIATQTSFVNRGRPFGEDMKEKTLSERNLPG